MSCARSCEAGLALVELMVAVALGMFLLLGVSQLFLDGKRHYLYQQARLANQENARLANLVIERVVTKAGYRAQPQDASAEEAFPALPASAGCPAFAAGQSIALALSANGRRAGLCVRYQRGLEAQEADCTGNPLAFSARPVSVLARLGFDSLAGEIDCVSRVEGVAGFASGSVLVEGLLDFRFQPLPTQQDAAQAIGLALLFASDQGADDGMAGERLEQWRALSGRSPEQPADGRRLLHISQLSLALRSLAP